MREEHVISRIADRLPTASHAEARRAALSVLGSIGHALTRRDAEKIGDELPPSWAKTLRDARHGLSLPMAELDSAVARDEGVDLGRAHEEVLVVCQSLAEELREPVLERLRRALPGDVAQLFRQPPVEPGGALPHPHAGHTTLAEGRPGSSHPLSEARPSQGQGESVVTAENPHSETKLSSAHGVAQEREGRDIASAQPPVTRRS